jgi:hypothetical protein
MDVIRDALSPYYAFPFMPVVQIDAPNWRRIYIQGPDYDDGAYYYVASEGPLAKPLPVLDPETGEIVGEHPLTFGGFSFSGSRPAAEEIDTISPPPRFVVGAKALVQLLQPNKSEEVRGEATDALRRKFTAVSRSLGWHFP